MVVVGQLTVHLCIRRTPHPPVPGSAQVDVGTETESLRQDPLYVGLPQRRVRGDAYWTLMLELVTALQVGHRLADKTHVPPLRAPPWGCHLSSAARVASA